MHTFLSGESELGAAEIGKRVQLDPSTTFRMLIALEAEGFLERDSVSGKFRLGLACLELGSRFLANSNVRNRALRALEKLRDEFGETAHLCVLDGTEIVYLEKLAGLHPIGLMSSHVGGRAPAHCTAVGKVLLAYLSEQELTKRFPQPRLTRYTDFTITDLNLLKIELVKVKANCFAIDNQENEPGVKCVAAPIFDHNGIIAALSLSGPVDRMDEHIAHGSLIPRLQEVIAEASVNIGWGRGFNQLTGFRAD